MLLTDFKEAIRQSNVIILQKVKIACCLLCGHMNFEFDNRIFCENEKVHEYVLA